MKKLDKRLLRTISKHKGQYIALTTLITIGIAIYLSFVMAVYNLDGTIKKYYSENDLADLYVNLYMNNDEIYNELNENTNILDIEKRGVYEGKIKFEDTAKVKLLTQTSDINKLYVDDGTKEINKNEVLVLKSFSDARKLNVGDNIDLKFNNKDTKLKIKGIVSSPEFIYLVENEQAMLPAPEDYGVIYVSNEFLEENIGENYTNEYLLKTKNEDESNKIKKYINENYGEKGVYFVSTKQEQLSFRMTEEEINGEIAMAQSLPLVFLIVALIILSIIIAKLVQNDRMSIGILKAMGYNNKSIIGYYTKLTLMIGLIGSIIGIILGGLGSYQFTKMYTSFFQVPMLSYDFQGKYIIQAIIISVCFSVLSGLIGARKVIHLMPQESMKPKAPPIGKHIFIEKTKWYSNLKFTNKMVIRNIFRQKGRFFLVVCGVALSCSMLLLPFAFNDLMNSMFIDQYEKYQVFDYDVTFKLPLMQDEIDNFKKEVKNSYVEEYISLPIDIEFKGSTRTTMVLGIKENSKVYNLITPEEKELELCKGDFYITEGLAKSFGIKKGDSITLKKYFGEEKEISVTVTEIVQQKLGSNGFMLANDIQDKFLESKDFTGVYVQGDINEDKVLENEKVASINSVKKLIDTFKQFTALIIMSLGIMIIFSGIFAFIVIYIVSIIAINERKHEFSSLRVLGLSKNEIFSIISRENMIASIFGIILGLPLGKALLNYLAAYFSNDLYSITINLKTNMIIFAALSTFVFVILGQGITKNKIKKLDFIEALKQRVS